MESSNIQNEALTSNTFSDIQLLNPRLVSNLSYHGYVNLTKIQSIAIPILAECKNGLICSPTGSGKTLTFLVPSINSLLCDAGTNKSRKDGTRIIVISPTRELTQQTFEMASKVTQLWPWIVVGSITGGEKKKAEKSSLRKGVTLLCTTPGRMLDHLQSTSSFVCNLLDCFILDEVDRLLDMGFEVKVKNIYTCLQDKADRVFQKILISATIDSNVERLANFCIGSDEKYARINVSDEKFHVPKTLTHEFIIAPHKHKFLILLSLLMDCNKAVVFVSNCATVDYFHHLISIITWPPEIMKGKSNKSQAKLVVDKSVFKIHGKIPQEDRVGFINDFVKADSGILVATDVASRGLNLKVDLVVQYDPPQQLEEYIHRSGRTARLGNSGKAVVILLESEQGIIGLLHDKGVYPTQASIHELYSKLFVSNALPEYRNPKNLITSLIRHLRNIISADSDLAKLANDAYLSSIKSYRTVVPQLRHVLQFKRLHLGHMAASFNLSHTPTQAANINASGLNDEASSINPSAEDGLGGGIVNKNNKFGKVWPLNRSINRFKKGVKGARNNKLGAKKLGNKKLGNKSVANPSWKLNKS